MMFFTSPKTLRFHGDTHECSRCCNAGSEPRLNDTTADTSRQSCGFQTPVTTATERPMLARCSPIDTVVDALHGNAAIVVPCARPAATNATSHGTTTSTVTTAASLLTTRVH